MRTASGLGDIESAMHADVLEGVLATPVPDDALYVASREGVLQAIPWCGGCLTNAAMAREAATMADRAAALGLG